MAVGTQACSAPDRAAFGIAGGTEHRDRHVAIDLGTRSAHSRFERQSIWGMSVEEYGPMRDLLRDFPELDSLEAGARQKLIVDTQKRIVRQPAILLGLIAAMSVPAVLALWSFPPHGLMGTLVTGGLVGLSGYGYLAVIVKPRMREAFRKMGNTPRT